MFAATFGPRARSQSLGARPGLARPAECWTGCKIRLRRRNNRLLDRRAPTVPRDEPWVPLQCRASVCSQRDCRKRSREVRRNTEHDVWKAERRRGRPITHSCAAPISFVCVPVPGLLRPPDSRQRKVRLVPGRTRAGRLVAPASHYGLTPFRGLLWPLSLFCFLPFSS